MKNVYLKPKAEYVDFSVEERLMAGDDLDDGMGGEMGTSGMPDGWE